MFIAPKGEIVLIDTQSLLKGMPTADFFDVLAGLGEMMETPDSSSFYFLITDEVEQYVPFLKQLGFENYLARKEEGGYITTSTGKKFREEDVGMIIKYDGELIINLPKIAKQLGFIQPSPSQ